MKRATGWTRRGWMGMTAGALVGGMTPCAARSARAEAERSADEPFGYCLNTSTIQGQKLGLSQEITLAGKAGFHALEPWIREMDEHVKGGGSLRDLGKQIHDEGMTVESAIGFFEWVVDDDARRAKALEEARRNMEMVRELGGTRLAAPPVGATDRSDLDPRHVAERYRALLELGDRMGVVPQVEIWGFSKTLGNLADAVQAAIGADHPSACVLADVYHLYKGGSGLHGLKLLSKDAIHVIHMNDYPGDIPRARITDADRVYPGDGVAPLAQIFRDLKAIGFHGVLSIELFNRGYWKQDAETVLRTALGKLRGVVKASFADTK